MSDNPPAEIDWRTVPKDALIAAFRSTTLGPRDAAKMPKHELVAVARETMQHPDKARQLRRYIEAEVTLRRWADTRRSR